MKVAIRRLTGDRLGSRRIGTQIGVYGGLTAGHQPLSHPCRH